MGWWRRVWCLRFIWRGRTSCSGLLGTHSLVSWLNCKWIVRWVSKASKRIYILLMCDINSFGNLWSSQSSYTNCPYGLNSVVIDMLLICSPFFEVGSSLLHLKIVVLKKLMIPIQVKCTQMKQYVEFLLMILMLYLNLCVVVKSYPWLKGNIASNPLTHVWTKLSCINFLHTTLKILTRKRDKIIK